MRLLFIFPAVSLLFGMPGFACATPLDVVALSETSGYSVHPVVVDVNRTFQDKTLSIFAMRPNETAGRVSWSAERLDREQLRRLDWKHDSAEVIAIGGNKRRTIGVITPAYSFSKGETVCPYDSRRHVYEGNSLISRLGSGYTICTSKLGTTTGYRNMGLTPEVVIDVKKVIELANLTGVLVAHENDIRAEYGISPLPIVEGTALRRGAGTGFLGFILGKTTVEDLEKLGIPIRHDLIHAAELRYKGTVVSTRGSEVPDAKPYLVDYLIGRNREIVGIRAVFSDSMSRTRNLITEKFSVGFGYPVVEDLTSVRRNTTGFYNYKTTGYRVFASDDALIRVGGGHSSGLEVFVMLKTVAEAINEDERTANKAGEDAAKARRHQQLNAL